MDTIAGEFTTMRTIGALKSRQVLTLKPPKGRRSVFALDGSGLYLQASIGRHGTIRRSWTFRYQLAGKRREMGLGSLNVLSLKEARLKAQSLRRMLLEYVDPLTEKRKKKAALLAEQARAVTFEECAKAYVELHGGGWALDHLRQWNSSLRRFVYPKIGQLAPAAIDSATVMKLVTPIWMSKPVTAGRVLDRVAVILDYATTCGYRTGDNPARLTRSALPKQAKITTVENLPALPFERMAEFMAALRATDTDVGRALELLILTASRPREVLLATWSEIDWTERKWNRPAAHMKGREDHTAPLCDRAVELLRAIGPSAPGAPLFVVGAHALNRLVKKLKPADVEATPHGFRSSFRQWATTRTNYPDHILEMALAHKVSDAVIKAYKRRAEPYERRCRLMKQWAEFINMPVSVVVPLHKGDAGA
jgi:integrase